MKPELERLKHDVATLQKALGLAPALRREWVTWMKRDNWLNLWWCVPGLILIASALLPLEPAHKYLGLLPAQWVGILVAGALVAIAYGYLRTLSVRDGRPDSLVRESRRLNGLDPGGRWINLALLLGLGLYFVWAKQYQIPFGAFWSGLFVFMGCSCLVLALASRVWLLLGWAVPFILYGLFVTLWGKGHVGAIPLGFMFMMVGLAFSLIQVFQIRKFEDLNGSH